MLASRIRVPGKRKISYNGRDYYINSEYITEFLSKIRGPIKFLSIDSPLLFDYYDEDKQSYVTTSLSKSFVRELSKLGWTLVYRSFMLDHINVYTVYKDNRLASMILLGKPVRKINESIKSVIKSKDYDLYYAKLLSLKYIDVAYSNDDYFDGLDLSKRPIQFVELVTSVLPDSVIENPVLFFNFKNFLDDFAEFNRTSNLPEISSPICCLQLQTFFSAYKILLG